MAGGIPMKSSPISFVTPMVRAVKEGRKTQTRRVVNPQYTSKAQHLKKCDDGKFRWWIEGAEAPQPGEVKCPYGAVGDTLWLKETWKPNGDSFLYRADDEAIEGPWKSSRFMPRSASRILLEITDIRVERVQEISDDNAFDEGVESYESGIADTGDSEYFCRNYLAREGDASDPWFVWFGYDGGDSPERSSFRSLWDSINAKRGLGWDENPLVWVIVFKVVEPRT